LPMTNFPKHSRFYCPLPLKFAKTKDVFEP
jgi:hypothetical protein